MKKISLIVTVFIFCISILGTVVFATTPTTNSNGITLVRTTAEVSGGETSTNSEGVTVELSTTSDESVGSTNPVGVTAYIGQFDAVVIVEEPVTDLWMIR